MRRSSAIHAVVPLAAALALGCGDQPGPSEPAGAPPSLAVSRQPGPTGAFVVHDEQGAFFFVDAEPAPGLSVLIGWTLAELDHFCATGELTLGSLDELLVFRPDETLHMVVRGAQIPLLVWESNSGDLCALPSEPHLTGTGQVSVTDNDVLVSGNRTDVAHVSIHGQVTSAAGERFVLVGGWHGMIHRGSGDEDARSEFRLVPLGR
jgi:hypothetical protein